MNERARILKIGVFSKLARVPVPTLRYYDLVGLLSPVEVDRFTGYRFYSLNQLPRLNRILALRGLGFSLDQIAAVLAEGLTEEQMRGMLHLRHAQIRQQLAETHSQLIEVEASLQQIEREANVSTYVLLKRDEPLLVALVRSTLPEHHAVGALFSEVYEAIRPWVGAALFPLPEDGGQSLVIWYDTEFKDSDVDGAAAFMLRYRVPESGRVRIQELPAVMMAATVHHGSYGTIGRAPGRHHLGRGERLPHRLARSRAESAPHDAHPARQSFLRDRDSVPGRTSE